jgi:sec-independent protein translocase protein TatA
MLGTQDLLIALAIGVFLFGAKKLPELAASLGKSMKEFKKATETEPEVPAPPPATTAAATPSRRCGSCQTALQADWTHCPRCGAPVATSA